ncbi:alpha/beta hydrolase [Bacillus pumilus]|uniref:alpha/beta fold hydrolase n=1 Tax=Bacillus pumilus TaxID=1408 RepID=UPI0024C15103|nr:alpha/beta hydrolase [Bacillus pumilus]WHX45238.1 alpha/beta hydrolase [Bacillus pumilus]
MKKQSAQKAAAFFLYIRKVDELSMMVKPIMIFLHGGGVSSWMWQEQIKTFKEAYECYTPDLIGHGTRADEQSFSMRESALEVISWIKQNAHGHKVILVGFSLGAQVAVEVLSKEPDIVDIAVINSALVMPLPWLYLMVRPLLPLTYPLLKKDWFIELQAEKMGLPNDVLNHYVADSKNLQKKTLLTMFQENLHYKLPDTFQQAKARILVTVGEKEKGIMKRSAKKITNSHPQAAGVVVPAIGHTFTFEKKELFMDMVQCFIEERTLPVELKEIK